MSEYRIQGNTGEWEVVIGLEVHAQVTSNAKLFSGASAAYGGEPNSHVSLVDAAMPGMLPVPNRECLRQAVRTGMAINAQINRWSRFDRKNYFYADLPQGYQISQLYHPIVGEGEIEVTLNEKDPDSPVKKIGIERIHVEQDAGKLISGAALVEQAPTVEPLFPAGAPTWYPQFSLAVNTAINSAAKGELTVAEATQRIADAVTEAKVQ